MDIMTLIGVGLILYLVYTIYESFNIKKEGDNKKTEVKDRKQITALELAVKAAEKGMELEQQKRYNEALDYYDVAIKGGIKCYSSRAGCNAASEWHLDAIDDYNKSIALDPSDCNLYYLRSLSKHSVGDISGLDDLKTAITLSKNNSKSSIENNENAKLMGYSSATFLYESSLLLYPEDEFIRNRLFKELSDKAKQKGRRIKI